MIVKGKAIYHAATGRFNTAGSMKLKSFYVVAQSAKNILQGAVFSGGRDRQLRGKDISLLIKAFLTDRCCLQTHSCIEQDITHRYRIMISRPQ